MLESRDQYGCARLRCQPTGNKQLWWQLQLWSSATLSHRPVPLLTITVSWQLMTIGVNATSLYLHNALWIFTHNVASWSSINFSLIQFIYFKSRFYWRKLREWYHKSMIICMFEFDFVGSYFILLIKVL